MDTKDTRTATDLLVLTMLFVSTTQVYHIFQPNLAGKELMPCSMQILKWDFLLESWEGF